MINNAGHHIYVDQADQFNSIIIEACRLADDEDANLPELTLKNGCHNLKENNSGSSEFILDDKNCDLATKLK